MRGQERLLLSLPRVCGDSQFVPHFMVNGESLGCSDQARGDGGHVRVLDRKIGTNGILLAFFHTKDKLRHARRLSLT